MVTYGAQLRVNGEISAFNYVVGSCFMKTSAGYAASDIPRIRLFKCVMTCSIDDTIQHLVSYIMRTDY